MRRVIHLANRIFRQIGGKIPEDDLRQYGYIGVCKAADLFDPGLGFQFGTFAAEKITFAILDGIRGETKSRSHGKGIRIHSIEDLQTSEDGNQPEEWAMFADPHSLHSDDIAATDLELQRQSSLWKAVSTLSGREMDVMLALFCDELTEKQTGDLFSITHGRVSQIKQSALKNLRQQLGAAA